MPCGAQARRPARAAALHPQRRTASAARSSRSSRLRGGDCARVLAIPGNRPREAFTERRPRLEAEQLARAPRVEATARLAVRHRGVPLDLAFETGELCDQLRQLAD